MSAIINDLYAGGGKETESTGVLEAFAETHSIDLNLLKATAAVESPQGAYDKEGRLPFLPEKHKFWRNLPASKRPKAERQRLAHRSWSRRTQYKGLGGTGSEARWKRLRDMANIDEAAALKSCSWGAYQILGENYRMCGYKSAQQFVLAMADSQRAQDEAFCSYIQSAQLIDELRDGDLRGFIRGYNGPGQVDYYLSKIAIKYKSLAGGPLVDLVRPRRQAALRMGMMNDPRVGALQKRLTELGFPVEADNDFGPITRKQVKAFQANYGIAADGLVGPETQQALANAQFKVPDSRAKANIDDIKSKPAVSVADKLKRVVAPGAAVVAVGEGAESLGLLDRVQGLLDYGQRLKGLIGAGSDLVDFAARNWWVLLIVLAIAAFYFARRINDDELEKHQTGQS